MQYIWNHIRGVLYINKGKQFKYKRGEPVTDEQLKAIPEATLKDLVEKGVIIDKKTAEKKKAAVDEDKKKAQKRQK